MSKKESHKNVTKKKKDEATRIMSPKQLKNCNIAIHSASAAAATAGAVPIPVADAIPITAAQVSMVIALGKIFDQKVTESAAKALISAAASTLIGRTAVKFIPIVGWGVSAAVAAGVTESIGWTVAVDFAKNAKSKWEKEHSDNAPGQNACAEEKSEEDKIIDSLQERAEPFISKNPTKNPETDNEEYKKLLNDFEKVLDKLNDNLRDAYDKLIDLNT